MSCPLNSATANHNLSLLAEYQLEKLATNKHGKLYLRSGFARFISMLLGRSKTIAKNTEEIATQTLKYAQDNNLTYLHSENGRYEYCAVNNLLDSSDTLKKLMENVNEVATARLAPSAASPEESEALSEVLGYLEKTNKDPKPSDQQFGKALLETVKHGDATSTEKILNSNNVSERDIEEAFDVSIQKNKWNTDLIKMLLLKMNTRTLNSSLKKITQKEEAEVEEVLIDEKIQERILSSGKIDGIEAILSFSIKEKTADGIIWKGYVTTKSLLLKVLTHKPPLQLRSEIINAYCKILPDEKLKWIFSKKIYSILIPSEFTRYFFKNSSSDIRALIENLARYGKRKIFARICWEELWIFDDGHRFLCKCIEHSVVNLDVDLFDLLMRFERKTANKYVTFKKFAVFEGIEKWIEKKKTESNESSKIMMTDEEREAVKNIFHHMGSDGPWGYAPTDLPEKKDLKTFEDWIEENHPKHQVKV